MSHANGDFNWRTVKDTAVVFDGPSDPISTPITDPALLRALEYARQLYECSLRGDVERPIRPTGRQQPPSEQA